MTRTITACGVYNTESLPPGLAVELCSQNDTSNPAVNPRLSLVYTADEQFCIEPVTQEGTVVAVLQCLLDRPARATLTGYNSVAYRSHSAQNGSNTMFYLTMTQRGLQGAPATDQITLTCGICSARSNPVVVNISYCSEGNQSAAPYLLGVPPASTVRIAEDQSADIALFNVIAKVSTMLACMNYN